MRLTGVPVPRRGSFPARAIGPCGGDDYEFGPCLEPVDAVHVVFEGRRWLYFGGCDYLRLSWHPAVRAAVREALDRYGLNVSASRMTTGNHPLYQEVEQRLAWFFRVDRAVLVPTGYSTNLAVAQALAGECSVVALDERAHASLADAACFFGCPAHRFAHRQPEALARLLARRRPAGAPVVLTEGLFGSDGNLAPLREYAGLLPARGWIVVDDAHAVGVLGRHGRGTPEVLGLADPRVVQTSTLSKAFGVYGGAILGSGELILRIIQRSRLLIGGTPVPLPLVAGVLAALDVLERDPSRRQRLEANVATLKRTLRTGGLPVDSSPAPIVALGPPGVRAQGSLRRRLVAAGIYPTFIRYPGGPAGGGFRFAVSCEHTREHLDRLAAALVAGWAER